MFAQGKAQALLNVLSEFVGGAERDRTADPLLAKQVLSQLSYSPSLSGTLRTMAGRQVDQTAYARFRVMQYTFLLVSSVNEFDPPESIRYVVGLGRIELPTSRLSGVRSNQLSYRPVSFRLRTFPGG